MIGRRLWGMFFGNVIPVEKYEYLEEKYERLKTEFRHYREKRELIEIRLRNEIKHLKRSDKYNSEIIGIFTPYIELKASDKARVKELEGLKTKNIFH